jgi:hypothetical protein
LFPRAPDADCGSFAGRQTVLFFGIAECKLENEEFKIAVQNSKFFRRSRTALDSAARVWYNSGERRDMHLFRIPGSECYMWNLFQIRHWCGR